MKRARLFYGHGTDNARDEAAALVFHAMGLAHDAAPRVLAKRSSAAQREKIDALTTARIETRAPLAYLTHNVTGAPADPLPPAEAIHLAARPAEHANASPTVWLWSNDASRPATRRDPGSSHGGPGARR